MAVFKENWESSVEEPTRPRQLVKDQGPRVDTTRFTFPNKPIYPHKTVMFDQDNCTAVQEKALAPLQDKRPALTAFESELRQLINKHSMENLSNTPDKILAEYLAHCLQAFTLATRQRESWYGRRVF